jgi:hypothetical protein
MISPLAPQTILPHKITMEMSQVVDRITPSSDRFLYPMLGVESGSLQTEELGFVTRDGRNFSRMSFIFSMLIFSTRKLNPVSV